MNVKGRQVKKRLGTPQARAAVDACLSLRDGLVASCAAPGAPAAKSSSPRVLFAIDDYSAMHHTTGYGRVDATLGRRTALDVEDLTLVRRACGMV